MEKTSPQEIDSRYREAGKILKRVAEIDSRLDQIQREGVAIKKHCTASKVEIRAEAEKHAKHLHERDALVRQVPPKQNFGRTVLTEAMTAGPATKAPARKKARKSQRLNPCGTDCGTGPASPVTC